MNNTRRNKARKRRNLKRPLSVVGWVAYESHHPCPDDPYSPEREAALYAAIRRDNVHHCGRCHQNDIFGCPLFSDGTVLRESMKNWAVNMDTVWHRHEEVHQSVKLLGKGWAMTYLDTAYPYACGRCSDGYPREYTTFIGPLHAYRPEPCSFREHVLTMDFMHGGEVVRPELGARLIG